MTHRLPRATARALLGTLCAAAALATPAVAQEPDTIPVPVGSVVIAPDVRVAALPGQGDAAQGQPMSPRGAFVRSMVLPGWGQAAFGSHLRGGVFFAGWAGNWFMNFKNVVRLDEARDRYRLRADELRESLLAASPDPDSLAMVLDTTDLLDRTIRADDLGDNLRKLVRARKAQREDWIAWSIFWILASGVDGYVTAHLADFPATIDVEPERDGGVSLRLEIPFGRRRP